ncbi:hypothetical protein B0T22DRAFT_132909 [Podospora appendiculata]|uniref:Uncharacterized protein n=1 Tax=Podospora appendiculata TaxID=314037 RepID=A0AAE0X7N3_9PEZI|nr:hypothetical protein B0T22DRAFT_132909 [Podospora appendiculata]
MDWMDPLRAERGGRVQRCSQRCRPGSACPAAASSQQVELSTNINDIQPACIALDAAAASASASFSLHRLYRRHNSLHSLTQPIPLPLNRISPRPPTSRLPGRGSLSLTPPRFAYLPALTTLPGLTYLAHPPQPSPTRPPISAQLPQHRRRQPNDDFFSHLDSFTRSQYVLRPGLFLSATQGEKESRTRSSSSSKSRRRARAPVTAPGQRAPLARET